MATTTCTVERIDAREFRIVEVFANATDALQQDTYAVARNGEHVRADPRRRGAGKAVVTRLILDLTLTIHAIAAVAIVSWWAGWW